MITPVDMLHVSYCQGNNIIPVGRLALKDRQTFFEYHPSFLETGLEISPYKLKYKMA